VLNVPGTIGAVSALPVQALLFDLGNVLIDIDFMRAIHRWAQYSSLSIEALRSVFQQDLAYQQHETGEISSKAYFDHLRASLKLEASDQQIAAGWNAILGNEISSNVEAIRKANTPFPCYVFTNSNPVHQMSWQTRFAEMLTHFERVFVSSDIGLRKPHRVAFEFVSREMAVPEGAILFFDDLPENVNGALAAGFQAVHVRSPADVQNALRDLGCVL